MNNSFSKLSTKQGYFKLQNANKISKDRSLDKWMR